MTQAIEIIIIIIFTETYENNLFYGGIFSKEFLTSLIAIFTALSFGKPVNAVLWTGKLLFYILFSLPVQGILLTP
jgi:hypothetical protein